MSCNVHEVDLDTQISFLNSALWFKRRVLRRQRHKLENISSNDMTSECLIIAIDRLIIKIVHKMLPCFLSECETDAGIQMSFLNAALLLFFVLYWKFIIIYNYINTVVIFFFTCVYSLALAYCLSLF